MLRSVDPTGDDFMLLIGRPLAIAAIVDASGDHFNAFAASTGLEGATVFVAHALAFWAMVGFFWLIDTREGLPEPVQRLLPSWNKLQPDSLVPPSEYFQMGLDSLKTQFTSILPYLLILHSFVLPWRRSLGFSLEDMHGIVPNFLGLFFCLNCTFLGFTKVHELWHRLDHIPAVHDIHSVHITCKRKTRLQNEPAISQRAARGMRSLS